MEEARDEEPSADAAGFLDRSLLRRGLQVVEEAKLLIKDGVDSLKTCSCLASFVIEVSPSTLFLLR
jgi:hypothetical protein